MPDHPTHPDVAIADGTFYGNDPTELYAWMRENAPVYWDEAAEVWGVAKYHDLKAISKDPATFSNAGGIRPHVDPFPMMIDMDDPEHWTRRKLVNRGFTPKRVRESEEKVRRVCNDIIDAVCERGECDLVRDIAAPLPMIMIGDMLGVEPDDRHDLLRWSDDMVKGLSTTATDDMLIAAANAHVEYIEYITRVIADRTPNPADDLVSLLIHAEVDGDKLAHDDVVMESLLILIGGDETTRHVVSEGMLQLLRNPGEHRKLLEDRAKVPLAVEEMLRWVSPIKNMARTVTTDTELRGQQLHKGEKLLLLYASANRDEEVFENPETFNVERTPNDHVAFGFGAHFCLGNSLARLEIRIMVEQLLERLPDLALADPDTPIEFRPANFISGPESIPATFTPTAALTP